MINKVDIVYFLSNLPTAVAKLPWTHNSILVEQIEDSNKRIWYAKKCLETMSQ